MTPTQREAAERLVAMPSDMGIGQWVHETASLLSELLVATDAENATVGMAQTPVVAKNATTEPLHEPKQTTASQFESVKDAKRAAEYELRYYRKMMDEKNAALWA